MSDGEGGLLSILQAHGQRFLQSFPSADRIKKRKCEEDNTNRSTKKSRKDDEYEEWTGINDTPNGERDNLSEDSDIDAIENDDGFTAQSRLDNVVIFSDRHSKPISSEKDYVSKAQMKAFMSSKVTKLTSSDAGPSRTQRPQTNEEEEDRTNAQNDAILHKLVHTKLLSGSLSTELDLTPSQRRKALAGRVLELAGKAKLGRGEKLVREAEKNRASKRVREGITSKQKERSKQELEEAKNLGHYHPILKKVFEASSTPTPRKREKGLKMGVGKFINGSLHLSRDDISKATGGHHGEAYSRKGAHRASRGKPRKQKSR